MIILKTPCKQKSRTGWLHWGSLPNIQGRTYIYPSQTIPKRILWNHHHADTKTRQRHHQKRKLQANIFEDYRCKNPQENISKANPTTHKKGHTPWSSGIHSKVTRMVPHLQVNQCDTPHHLNRCRKNVWYHSTSNHNKNSHQNGYRGNISQHNKGYLWQPTANIIYLMVKSWVFLLHSGKKTRVPTLITSIQHSIGSPCHSKPEK